MPAPKILHDDNGRILWPCPACDYSHGTPIRGPNAWTYNGDDLKPTISPSVRVRCEYDGRERVCHFFVRDGQIVFCDDCTHDLAGQTVPMLDA